MRAILPLVLLLAAACAARRPPEAAVPLCMESCAAPRAEELVGVIRFTPRAPAGTERVEVTGEQLDRLVGQQRTARPPAFWIHLDFAGRVQEVRLAESSGDPRVDRELAAQVSRTAFDVDRPGWYRATVERRPAP